MLSSAAKNIMIRVIKKRMAAGEKITDILKSYPKLDEKEKKELKEAVSM